MTLEEFEKATLRLVALKMSRTLPRAADRLGMATVSLDRWVKRRRPLPPLGLVTGGDPLNQDIEEFDGPDMDDEERAELQREIEASFDDEENGRLVDAADFSADLKAHRQAENSTVAAGVETGGWELGELLEVAEARAALIQAQNGSTS